MKLSISHKYPKRVKTDNCMKDTHTVARKEPKFAAIEVLITNQNFYTRISMNQSQAFWRLAAHLFIVLFSLKTAQIDAKNPVSPSVSTTHSTTNLRDISLFASITSATVGSLVTIEVTTDNFTDVEDFQIPMAWNPSLLTFQSVNSFSTEVPNFTVADFNLANVATGSLSANWMAIGPTSSVTNGTTLFKITFRVAAYSNTPASVMFNNLATLSITTSGGIPATITPRNGSVRLINPNPCPSRPAGTTCQTAPILSATEFPYSQGLSNPTPQPIRKGDTCVGGIENPHWIAFIAASTSLTVKVRAGTDFSLGGLQFFVHEIIDCDTFRRVSGGCHREAIIRGEEDGVNLTDLIIGKQYYIMIDGYFGDVGSYAVSIANGQVYNATQAITPPTITGSGALCGARTGLTYSIPTVATADLYEWRIPSTATATTPIRGATQTSINVNWGSVSDSVCVRIAARCDTTPWSCKFVRVGTPVTNPMTVTKCPGIPYSFKGQSLYAAGEYRDTLTGSSGCDSIVILTLQNLLPLSKDTTVTKCTQATFFFKGQNLTAAGTYRDTSRTAFGCDSITVLTLQNRAPTSKDTTVTKCAQTVFVFKGQNLTAAGTYRDTARTAFGCDSITVLNLVNYPAAIRDIDTTVCAGTSVTVGGRTYSIADNYTVNSTTRAYLGCDSTIFLRLNILDFIVTPSKSGNITCQTPQITLSSRIQNQPTGATIAYEWRNAANTIIGTNPSVLVNQAGTFTLTAFVTWNGRTCAKFQTIDVTKSGNQPTKPTLTGQPLSCVSNTEIYSIPTPAANVDSFNWTVTNGTFTKQTNQITTTWNANATIAQVCVNAQNACGVSDTACFSVTIGRIPTPLSIIGKASVCKDEITTYRITPPANTTFLWALANGSALNPVTTDSLRVRWGTSNGRISVTPTNRCGNGTPTELVVEVSTELPDSLPIQGFSAVCSNDTTTYTVAASATTTDYIWQVPTGAIILRGQGTRTIVVVWGTFAGNGQVFLTTKNICQLARGVGFNVSVKNAAFAAPSINGSRTVCPSTQISFSTFTNTNFRSYTWTVPSNTTLLRGQGTDSVRVDWGTAASGQVCLEIENTCGVRQRTCIDIEVRADLDSLVIAGGTTVCKDSTLRFCVPDDGSASRFLWQIPTVTGGSIVSGQGTSCVTVRFASTSGTVRVTPVGGCSDGKLSRRDVIVKLPPSIVGGITGKNTVCNNSTETYSVASQTDITRYSWGLPIGATFIGDSLGNTITINTSNMTSGFLTVRAENNCGLGNGATLRITVVARPQVNAGVDTAYCGKIGTLKGSSNGVTKTWSVATKPSGATVTFASANNSQTAITVSQSGVYTFRFEEINAGNCGMADSVTLTFRNVPTVTTVDQICNQEATHYRLQLNAVGGTGPFSWGGTTLGTIQGNTFLSDSIPSGTAAFFIATDAFGCKSDTVRGARICPCYTSAGTLQADSIIVCFGLTGKVTPLGDAKLDATDVFDYVLHNGTASRIGTILLQNKTGVFNYTPPLLAYNQVYYITFLVGDQRANGTVDTSKRCVSQTRGIPIVFKDRFTAGLFGDTTVCRFSPARLRFQANQTGLIDLTYRADSGTIAFALAIQNNTLINIVPSLSATYKIVDATDRNGCKAQITDSARINLRPFPISNAGLDRSVCNNRIELDARENLAYLGRWTSLTSGVLITDPTNPRTGVEQLQNGKNTFIWAVSDTACLDYTIRDTVEIFLPILPKAVNLSLITKMGVPVSGNVSENAPLGTYSVTRLTNPTNGRFDLFSSGAFTYIPEPKFVGIVKFRYIICSDLCTQLCDTGEVRILIQPTEDTVKVIKIAVPNAITPNDDGKNDALVIDGIEQYPENELVLFNRWGDILYKSKPYKNDWRGTNQSGQDLPEGTYYYVLRLNTADGKILRGDMTILR